MGQSVSMGGGGAASFKFTTVGDTIEGDIVDIEEQQIISLETEQPETWPNGNPKMQIQVTIQTDYQDGEGIDPDRYSGEDDGLRRIWIKGHMYTAVREAVRVATAKSLDAGGVLKVRFDAIGEKKKAAHQPPKLFKAKYTPPPAASVAMGVDDDDF